MDNQTAVRLNIKKKIYPKEVVMMAAYVFLDRCYVFIDQPDKDHFLVELRPKSKVEGDLAGEFENQLIMNSLRLKIVRDTKMVRDMIFARAIGQSMPKKEERGVLPNLPPEVARLLESTDEDMDYNEDPLGIAIPWEEKFGKKGGESDS